MQDLLQSVTEQDGQKRSKQEEAIYVLDVQYVFLLFFPIFIKALLFNSFFLLFQCFLIITTLTNNSSYNYLQLKETGLFDVWTEQWLMKCLPVHDFFI